MTVIAQVIINRKQWQAMQDAVKQAEEQTRISGESFETGNQSYVGIHSIQTDPPKSGRVLIQIENVGVIPADRIKVVFDLFVMIPLEYIPARKRSVTAKHFEKNYGRTPLFRGNFKIVISLRLDKLLTTEELSCVMGSRGGLVIAGHIEYQDGFSAAKDIRRETPFSFRYIDYKWIPNEDSWEEDLE